MITILCLMTLISFGMRILPFLFANWLQKWSVLEKLGLMLPPCILILLVAHNLEQVSFRSYPFGLPEIVGLIGVLIAQIWFRSLLISMGAGLIFHQILLRLI